MGIYSVLFAVTVITLTASAGPGSHSAFDLPLSEVSLPWSGRDIFEGLVPAYTGQPDYQGKGPIQHDYGEVSG